MGAAEPLHAAARRTIYRGLVRQAVARALSMQDREPTSPTYGCFDRNYWGWKFVDFPGARFQEGAFALAFAYADRDAQNPFAGQANLREWSLAGLRYWAAIQRRNGSFDEAYPRENSFVATAFTLLSVGETLRTLGADVPADSREPILRAVQRAGDWLCRHDERHAFISNHLAGAAAALRTASLLTGRDDFRQRSRFLMERIAARQSPDGWFREYDGPDPGYETQGIFYQALVWRDGRDERVLEGLRRSMEYLAYQIGPDGAWGTALGSRNTEFYFPGGLEILAATIPRAAAIAARLAPTLAAPDRVHALTVDPYNFFPLLFSTCNAARFAHDPEVIPSLPCDEPDDEARFFPDSRFLVRRTARYVGMFHLGKGGVARVYDRRTGEVAHADAGFAASRDGRWGVSQGIDSASVAAVGEDEAGVVTGFRRREYRVLSPGGLLLFRLVSLVLGRFDAPARWLKKAIVRALIDRRRPFPLRLERRFAFDEETVEIKDTITRLDRRPVDRLWLCSRLTPRHMGSAGYFSAADQWTPNPLAELDVTALNRDGAVTVTRTVPPERP